jgi:hypothetical protein
MVARYILTEDNIKKNQEIILNIIDVIVVMGQRNIPFRGHIWDKLTKREDRNFDGAFFQSFIPDEQCLSEWLPDIF